LFILTTLLHVIAFGIVAVDLQYLGGRMVLFFALVPVLPLHIAMWAAARFLALPWTIVSAILLNVVWAAAGLVWWASRTPVAPIPWQQALANAAIFVIAGLVTGALLIAWVRAMTRRRLAAKG
jgi:hypothetical protein